VQVSDFAGRPLLLFQFFGPLSVISLFSVYYVLSYYVHELLGQAFVAALLIFVLWWFYRYGNVTVGIGPRKAQRDLTLPNLKPHERVRFVCVSDTHSNQRLLGKLPEGDVLLHAGDITNRGTMAELKIFNTWLGNQPHRHKLVIAGNHDYALDKKYHDGSTKNCKVMENILTNCTYLNNKAVTVHGYKIYGRPESPEFHHMAFNRRRGKEMMECWEDIPDDTDILLTHTPPFMIRDRTFFGKHVGCAQLTRTIQTRLPQLKVHIFGHIHEDYGVAKGTNGRTIFINAAICNMLNGTNHRPIVFDLPRLKED